LEHLERVLIKRALPAQSWVRRVLHRRGGRVFDGGRALGRSSNRDPAGTWHADACAWSPDPVPLERAGSAAAPRPAGPSWREGPIRRRYRGWCVVEFLPVVA